MIRQAWLPMMTVLATLPTGAAADGLDPQEFSCRASALRAEGPVFLEPVVANSPDVPCQDSDASLVGVTVGDISASALTAETDFTNTGSADGAVANAFSLAAAAAVSDLVSAEVLVADAQVDSVIGRCELQGFSFVGSATVLGLEVTLIDGHLEVPLPGVGTVHFNETIVEEGRITQRALWLESTTPLIEDVIVAEASADFEGENPCASGQGKPDKGLWMTGGGSIRGATRVTHGFKLECDATHGPNNLQINWDGGNKFHLETLQRARCRDDAQVEPDPPPAAFDTYQGSGSGRLNGVPGATASWTFTDAGQPGVADTARIVVRNSNQQVVLDVQGTLDRGNHQAHGAR